MTSQIYILISLIVIVGNMVFSQKRKPLDLLFSIVIMTNVAVLTFIIIKDLWILHKWLNSLNI